MKLILTVCLAALAAFGQQRIPILFDTDIGDSVDDAVALALALRSPELDIRGVTTVTDDTEARSRLAWKELGIFARRDIPVATGAPEPLLDPVHFGHSREFNVLTPGDALPPAARKRAADFIIETLLASQQKITIVAIGPLTNIALAIKTEPAIKDKIERIVLMGGAYSLPQAEYNIQRDRAAAAIVFQSNLPITAVGLDVTLQCKLRPQDLNRLRIADGPAAHFIMHLIELAKADTHEDYPTLHDPLALAVVFRPDLVETAAGRVKVPLDDNPSGGGLTQFVPAGSLPGVQPTTLVARRVNVAAFLDLLIQRLATSLP